MDIGLIFPNRLIIVTRSGGTQEDRHASLLDMLVEARSQFELENPLKRFNVRSQGTFYGREDVDFTLPRKASLSRLLTARTVNRHR